MAFKADFITLKLLLFVVGILASELELAFTYSPWLLECNKTVLHMEMEKCGGRFKTDMVELAPENWCNLTQFIGEYHYFTACTENNAMKIGCFWPNPMAEHYIVHIHRQFFSNCTLEPMVWVESSEDTHTTLIITSVFLTLAVVTLVIWCSRQNDLLA